MVQSSFTALSYATDGLVTGAIYFMCVSEYLCLACRPSSTFQRPPVPQLPSNHHRQRRRELHTRGKLY